MATTSTGLFYVYAKNINDDWSYRYLITFATREVADKWYRLVTDSVAGGYARFKSVKQVSLQFFTHNPGEGNIPDTLTDPKVAASLLGQMFFTLINDRDGRIQSMVPVLNYTKYNNGDRFYIRSVSQPDTFWFYDASKGLVVASRNRRTRFTITIADPNRAPGTVMIGSDNIYMTIGSSQNIGTVNQQDQLGSSINPFPLKFSSFNGDLLIDYYSDSNDAGLGPVALNPGQGENWELV
jgi:hypothetical protein